MTSPFARPDEDHPATLGGARRPIAWESLDPTALDASDRVAVGERWKARYIQEHLAVGAFAQLAWEVAANGGDPVVLAMLTRAASDEVRHAEICKKAAQVLLGDEAVPARLRGTPQPPAHAEAPPADRALYHVVEMCCLSETFTGVYLTESLARASHPTMRAVLESLLEDEIDHGRVGWAHLAGVASERKGAGLEGLARALPDMLDRTIGRVLHGIATHPEPDTGARGAVGHIGSEACADLFKRTLREVIVPGFEAIGVDLRPTRAAIVARGWS